MFYYSSNSKESYTSQDMEIKTDPETGKLSPASILSDNARKKHFKVFLEMEFCSENLKVPYSNDEKKHYIHSFGRM